MRMRLGVTFGVVLFVLSDFDVKLVEGMKPPSYGVAIDSNSAGYLSDASMTSVGSASGDAEPHVEPSVYSQIQIARENPGGPKWLSMVRRYDTILQFPNDLWSNEKKNTLRVSSNRKNLPFFDWQFCKNFGKCLEQAPDCPDSATSYFDPRKGASSPGKLEKFEVMRSGHGVPLYPLRRSHPREVNGRGVLYDWGPNHCGDAVVTQLNPETNRIEILLIKRSDGSGAYALPGGFLNPSESDSPERGVVREFIEEAVGWGDCVDGKKQGGDPDTLEAFQKVFGGFKRVGNEIELDAEGKKSSVLYTGIVKDIRNTVNAWIETTALHWHIEDPEIISKIKVSGHDDADAARFIDLCGNDDMGVYPLKNLFASHSQMLRDGLPKHWIDSCNQ